MFIDLPSAFPVDYSAPADPSRVPTLVSSTTSLDRVACLRLLFCESLTFPNLYLCLVTFITILFFVFEFTAPSHAHNHPITWLSPHHAPFRTAIHFSLFLSSLLLLFWDVHFESHFFHKFLIFPPFLLWSARLTGRPLIQFLSIRFAQQHVITSGCNHQSVSSNQKKHKHITLVLKWATICNKRTDRNNWDIFISVYQDCARVFCFVFFSTWISSLCLGVWVFFFNRPWPPESVLLTHFSSHISFFSFSFILSSWLGLTRLSRLFVFWLFVLLCNRYLLCIFNDEYSSSSSVDRPTHSVSSRLSIFRAQQKIFF